MNPTTKKVIGIILGVFFILFNLLHIIFLFWLIKEDIELGTIVGTKIEMGVLYPWLIEIVSIPLVVGEIIYLIVFCKVPYLYKFNLISFCIYIFQVILFNFLLSF